MEVQIAMQSAPNCILRDQRMMLGGCREMKLFENQNQGANALVQMWEAKLNPSEAKLTPSNSKKFDDSRGITQNCEPIAENDGVRITEIIKKLASDRTDNGCKDKVGHLKIDVRKKVNVCGPEHGGLSQIISSPKIRGRQAFTELLMQMEQERRREVDSLRDSHLVSRFLQRGRIQSVLRLKLLQRGIGTTVQQRPLSSTPLSTASLTKGSLQFAATYLSGRCLEYKKPAMAMDEGNSNKENPRSTETLSVSDTDDIQVELVTTSVSDSDGNADSESVDEEHSLPIEHNPCEKCTPGGNILTCLDKEASMAFESFDQQQALDTTQSFFYLGANESDEEHNTCEEDADNVSYESFPETPHSKSYWEERKKEWYQEIVCTASSNDDIRQLIERRTVSTYLSSDFREKMDQLIASRVRGLYPKEPGGSSSVRDGNTHCFRRSFAEEEEKEETASHKSSQSSELSDYYYNHSSPLIHFSSPTSWNDTDNHKDEDVSPKFLHSPSSPHASEDNSNCSSITHASIEMELVCSLRAQMEELQREMRDLKNSLHLCMDVQAAMQESLKSCLFSDWKNQLAKTTPKHNCCICHKNQANSFLNSCEHMCACMKCSNELLQN